jgi:uncharacterized protein
MNKESIDELKKILACPSCKGAVSLENDKITCNVCGLRYTIKDGIPIMLIDQAEKTLFRKEG